MALGAEHAGELSALEERKRERDRLRVARAELPQLQPAPQRAPDLFTAAATRPMRPPEVSHRPDPIAGMKAAELAAAISPTEPTSPSHTFERLRRAIMASGRARVVKLRHYVWTKAMPTGMLSGAEAQQLAELAEGRIREPVEPGKRTSVGSRPRTPASRPRTRRWASDNWIPGIHAERFTEGQRGVLAVIAAEVASKGVCRMALDHIAALAGVCKSTVRTAVRRAAELHLVWSTERRRSTWRNETNEVSIIDKAWRLWLDRRPGMKKRKKGAETRTRAQAGKAWCHRKEDDRRAAETLRRERLQPLRGEAATEFSQQAADWQVGSAMGGGSNVVNPPKESFHRKESPFVASQLRDENRPNGSSFSGGGLFAAARLAARHLGLDPSPFGSKVEDWKDIFEGPEIDGTAVRWT